MDAIFSAVQEAVEGQTKWKKQNERIQINKNANCFSLNEWQLEEDNIIKTTSKLALVCSHVQGGTNSSMKGVLSHWSDHQWLLFETSLCSLCILYFQKYFMGMFQSFFCPWPAPLVLHIATNSYGEIRSTTISVTAVICWILSSFTEKWMRQSGRSANTTLQHTLIVADQKINVWIWASHNTRHNS